MNNSVFQIKCKQLYDKFMLKNSTDPKLVGTGDIEYIGDKEKINVYTEHGLMTCFQKVCDEEGLYASSDKVLEGVFKDQDGTSRYIMARLFEEVCEGKTLGKFSVITRGDDGVFTRVDGAEGSDVAALANLIDEQFSQRVNIFFDEIDITEQPSIDDEGCDVYGYSPSDDGLDEDDLDEDELDEDVMGENEY